MINVMLDHEQTGKNLKSARIEAGLKVDHVRQACGFKNPQSVYNWERGVRSPSTDHLGIISKLYNKPIGSLLATTCIDS